MKAEIQQSEPVETVSPEMEEWCEAVAQDIEQLAALHDRELDGQMLSALKAVGFPRNLGFPLKDELDQPELSDVLKQPLRFFETSLFNLTEPADEKTLDNLAVDYADIYLNHSLHASPYESVWLDEDHLTQQEPMFKVRNWYRRYSIESENWRIRSDDHLVLQLQFVALLLDPASNVAAVGSLQKRIEDATRFLDEHLLLWIKDFRNRVVERCGTDLYASLAVLTVAYLDQLRDALTTLTGIERLTDQQIDEIRNPANAVVEQPISFIPGVAESW